MIIKILDYIESKRGSKNIIFLFLLITKDTGWFTIYYLPRVISQMIFLLRIYLGQYRYGVNKYYKISMCITCMNRAEHLKKTLKKNLRDNKAYPNLEFVILDYNSQDDLQEWVFSNFKDEIRSGKIVYYQTRKPKFFEMSKAKNIVHHLATGEIVCSLDADNYTGRDFAFYMNSKINADNNIVGRYDKINDYPLPFGCWGRIFILKKFFMELGGYDEKYIYYGWEDNDFKIRAMRYGLKLEIIPYYFLKSIDHSNELRGKNMPMTIEESKILNVNVNNSKKENEVTVFNDAINLSEYKKILL